jgi:Family of unknown function (DUF6338)
VLPGFISAAVRATLKPGDSPSAGEWVAGSIVASLFLNASAFFLYLFLVGGIDLNRPLAELQIEFGGQTGKSALIYVGLLYALALAWGLASGFADEGLTLRVLAYRLRLTPISPTTTVFIDVLERLVGGKDNRRRRGDPDQQVAWIRVRRDNRIIQGRISKSSVRFAVSEPIEVYLQPAYIFDTGAIIERDDRRPDADKSSGIYLRLRPEDVVEISVAPASWRPRTSPPALMKMPDVVPPPGKWQRMVLALRQRIHPKPGSEPARTPDRTSTREQLAPPSRT